MSRTIAALPFFLFACGEAAVGTSPRVQAIDDASLKLGQTVRFRAENFLDGEAGFTTVRFLGVFTPTGGAARWVDFEIRPTVATSDNSRMLQWNRFGPYESPFGGDNETGLFEGELIASNHRPGGTVEVDPAPLYTSISVDSSIAIKRLEPILGSLPHGEPHLPGCSHPALRVFGGVPYLMEVEAVGFEPVRFDYEVQGGQGSLYRFSHAAMGLTDIAGDPRLHDEQLIFDVLEDHVEFDYARITITAIDQQGNAHVNALPVPLVRTMRLFHDGVRHVAQYYDPVVVHGPIIGGIGTTVSYVESHSESRQRGVAINISKSFSESQGVTTNDNWSTGVSISETASTADTAGTSGSEGGSDSNTDSIGASSSTGTSGSHSTTDGTNWSWAVGENLKGDFSIAGIGMSGGASNSNTWGGSASTSESFGTTTNESTSTGLAHSYGTNWQTSINSSTTQSRATSKSSTVNMGGSESINEGTTRGDSEAWSETWSSSESDSALLSYSSKVPRERCAVVYRQTVRFVREAELWAYDLCGEQTTAAALNFNEWSWSPNIAIADDCQNSLPPSTQPKAACFRACE
jgi:hypothetical protein